MYRLDWMVTDLSTSFVKCIDSLTKSYITRLVKSSICCCFLFRITFSTGKMNMTGLRSFQVKELSASTDDLFAVSGAISIPSLTLISGKNSTN